MQDVEDIYPLTKSSSLFFPLLSFSIAHSQFLSKSSEAEVFTAYNQRSEAKAPTTERVHASPSDMIDTNRRWPMYGWHGYLTNDVHVTVIIS